MASGKSTIGRKLARKLSRAFLDTDAIVVRAHGPIDAIFRREGEPAFRRYEQAAIAHVLAQTQPSVVALGGGALTTAENRRLLDEHAVCVFIKITAQQVLTRVRRGGEVRPMLGTSPTLAAIEELYAERMPQYESADYVVDASHRSDAQVIEQIIRWLHQTKLESDGGAS